MQDNSFDIDGATELESCFWEDSSAGENKIHWEKWRGDGEGEEGEIL